MNSRSSTSSEKILKILKKKSQRSVKFAKDELQAEKIESEKVREAMEYYLSNWTFSTHQGLFAIACESVNGKPNGAVETQAAMAMLTAAVDVHDDIIDRSSIKHGKSTVFGKYGLEIALLLGNAFFVSGFTLLGKCVTGMSAEKARRVMETVKRLMFEVGTAHALELNLKKRFDVRPEEYMRVLRMKAASAEASMRLGAIIGGGTEAEVEALTRYGRILGLLATIREEFIDIYETKELRQRIENECLPAPILYVLQGENPGKIKSILMKRQATEADANKILDLVMKSRETEKLKKSMNTMVDEGMNFLSELARNDSKELLTLLLRATREDL